MQLFDLFFLNGSLDSPETRTLGASIDRLDMNVFAFFAVDELLGLLIKSGIFDAFHKLVDFAAKRIEDDFILIFSRNIGKVSLRLVIALSQ